MELKFTSELVAEVRKAVLVDKWPQSFVAKHYGVSRATVSRIIGPDTLSERDQQIRDQAIILIQQRQKSLKVIASEFGLTRAYLNNLLGYGFYESIKQSIKNQAIELIQDGTLTKKEIAIKLGISTDMLYDMTRHLSRNRPTYTDEMKSRVIQLYSEGITYKNIVAATGVSIPTIDKWITEAKIPRRSHQVKHNEQTKAKILSASPNGVGISTDRKQKTLLVSTEPMAKADRQKYPVTGNIPKLPTVPRFKSTANKAKKIESTPPPEFSVPRDYAIPVKNLGPVMPGVTGLGHLTSLMASPAVREAISRHLQDNFTGHISQAYGSSNRYGLRFVIRMDPCKPKNPDYEVIPDKAAKLIFGQDGAFIGIEQITNQGNVVKSYSEVLP